MDEKLVAGILMNLVALEERHVMRDAALQGKSFDDDDTVDFVYAHTVANVVKRFPDGVREHLKAMLTGEGMRDTIATDLARHKDAPWLTT